MYFRAYILYISSVKPPQRRRIWLIYLSQIGYLSQIAWVLQFILQPVESIWGAASSMLKAGGGIWRVEEGIRDLLTIWVLNLNIICEDL